MEMMIWVRGASDKEKRQIMVNILLQVLMTVALVDPAVSGLRLRPNHLITAQVEDKI